ncbi:MAG: DUF2007 domain-containing protein [Gammaproteobacteria bacterium]
MKKVYSNELLPLAGHVQGLLQSNGIACLIKNQNLGSAMGEIPPQECWPEVWIYHAEDYDEAMRLVDLVTGSANEGQTIWNCQCGEENGATFFSCWNCGAERIVPTT